MILRRSMLPRLVDMLIIWQLHGRQVEWYRGLTVHMNDSWLGCDNVSLARVQATVKLYSQKRESAANLAKLAISMQILCMQSGARSAAGSGRLDPKLASQYMTASKMTEFDAFSVVYRHLYHVKFEMQHSSG